MDLGSMIDWIVGMPVVVLILVISLWWLLGRNDKGLCPQCGAPKIFGSKCLSCGNISVESDNRR